MRALLFVLSIPVLLLIIGCESMSSAPTKIEDQASGIAVTFPGFPVNHTTSEHPHRRMAAVLHDSISVWLSIVQHGDDFSEEVRTQTLAEANKMLQQQKFEKVTRIDSTFHEFPSSLLWYTRNQEQMYHFVVFKDSFIVDLSALITDTSQYHRIDRYFSSLTILE